MHAYILASYLGTLSLPCARYLGVRFLMISVCPISGCPISVAVGTSPRALDHANHATTKNAPWCLVARASQVDLNSQILIISNPPNTFPGPYPEDPRLTQVPYLLHNKTPNWHKTSGHWQETNTQIFFNRGRRHGRSH